MANQNPANPGQPALISDREKQPSQQGTGFVNLQKYLDANQGNQLGSAVSGNINQATQATQSDLAQQQNQFNQGLQNTRAGISQGQQNVQNTFQQIDNPNFSGLSQPQIQGFQNITNNPYSGPTGYANPQVLQQQAANAASLGQLAGTRPGRQELLRETINSPKYTNSQQTMDELLLSLGGGNQAVQQAGRSTRGLQNQVNQNVGTAQLQGQQAQQAYQKLQQQATGGVQQRQQAINQQVANAVQNAQNQQQQRNANFATYQQMLAQGNPGAAGFAASNGLFNSGTANDLSAIAAQLPSSSNISQDIYANINQGNIPQGQGAVATSQQKAQLGALAQLAQQQAPSWLADASQQAVAPTYKLTAAQKQQVLNDVMNKYYNTDQQAQLNQLTGGSGRAGDFAGPAVQQFLAMSKPDQDNFINYLNNMNPYLAGGVGQASAKIYQSIQQGQQEQQALTPILGKYTS